MTVDADDLASRQLGFDSLERSTLPHHLSDAAGLAGADHVVELHDDRIFEATVGASNRPSLLDQTIWTPADVHPG